MDRTVTIRPPKRPAPGLSDRAQARMIRQKLLEEEQELEDLEALRATPEELRILQDSVSSVKAEFTDLDGLSWDTPSARHMLLNWHTQQALRSSSSYNDDDDVRLSNLALRMRGASPSPRRSLASLIYPPGLSASAPNLSELSTATVRPRDHVRHSTATIRSPTVKEDSDATAFDMTIRARPQPAEVVTPASRTLGLDSNTDNEQSPLPALFHSVPRESADLGPALQPSRFTADVDIDVDADAAFATPVPADCKRPPMPKSHSAPCVFSSDRGAFLRASSPSPLEQPDRDQSLEERPTKPLRPSRIPIFRSKSLGAKPAAEFAAQAQATRSFSASLPASVSAPVFCRTGPSPYRIAAPRSPRRPRPRPALDVFSPPKPRAPASPQLSPRSPPLREAALRASASLPSSLSLSLIASPSSSPSLSASSSIPPASPRSPRTRVWR